MKPSLLTKLDDLVSASCAIFTVALSAAVVAFVSCLCTGLEPFGLNYLQHGVVGAAIAFSFVAGSVAVGGRRAWAFVGALGGVCIALFFAASMPRSNSKHTDSCGTTIVSVFISTGIGTGFAGKFVGRQIGNRLDLARSQSRWLAPIANVLHNSRLYEQPIVLRMTLALLQMTPILIATPGLLRRLAEH